MMRELRYTRTCTLFPFATLFRSRIIRVERAAGVTKNEQLPWRRRDQALFVAFAPVHKPRYACAVVVEHGGGGSTVAAPIARDILLETQHRDPSGRRSLPKIGRAHV